MRATDVAPLSPEEIAVETARHAPMWLNSKTRVCYSESYVWPCPTARLLVTLEQSTANFEKLKAMYQEDSTILESLRLQLAEAVEAREAQALKIHSLTAERIRTMELAYQWTLDCQTPEEGVQALLDIIEMQAVEIRILKADCQKMELAEAEALAVVMSHEAHIEGQDREIKRLKNVARCAREQEVKVGDEAKRNCDEMLSRCDRQNTALRTLRDALAEQASLSWHEARTIAEQVKLKTLFKLANKALGEEVKKS